uniref:D-glycerate 3-kinase, chloroplastic n=1 Tax=Ananas comosus var. bracteatus TaxID=296719 RepID=A0A6V7NXL1_ANACO|nr:unnamed protein product [Ananas comosus var. bracteatus]
MATLNAISQRSCSLHNPFSPSLPPLLTHLTSHCLLLFFSSRLITPTPLSPPLPVPNQPSSLRPIVTRALHGANGEGNWHLTRLGFTAESIAESIDRWLQCGVHLCQLFQLNKLRLSVPRRLGSTITTYRSSFGVKMKFCDTDQHSRTEMKFHRVSAPQGSGKTTLVFALDYLFRRSSRNAATLSIDDFYLTAEEQAKLRSRNPGNALLELRGNAGSHDLQFSIETLTSLSKMTKKGMKMKLPRYDKSAFGGKGDRADPSTWPVVEGPIEVVLFEGGCLDLNLFQMMSLKQLIHRQFLIFLFLEVVNKNLEAYYDAWDKFIEAWIVIKIKDPNCVFQWRLQAEIAMREDGKPGMSNEEVLDFVSRYLPAYKAYLPTLYAEGPNGADPNRLIVIEIDEQRNPQ